MVLHQFGQKQMFFADGKPLNRLPQSKDLRARFRWGFWRMRTQDDRRFPRPTPACVAIFAQAANHYYFPRPEDRDPQILIKARVVAFETSLREGATVS